MASRETRPQESSYFQNSSALHTRTSFCNISLHSSSNCNSSRAHHRRMCPGKRVAGQHTELADSQLGLLRDAFNVLDSDGDGIIAASDLENFLSSIATRKTFPQGEVDRMIALGNGNINFDQFLNLLHYSPESNGKTSGVMKNSTELRDMFRVLDTNGDGVICSKDLKNVMSALGQSLSENDLRAMLPTDNGSFDLGEMSYEDFVDMMASSHEAGARWSFLNAGRLRRNEYV